MKKLKNKKLLMILVGFILFAIFIAALVLFYNAKNSKSSNSYNPVSVSDIETFISSASLPPASESIEREEIEKDGFVISAAKEGNIDSPVSFSVGEGKISFTSIGNSNLGRMNNSELIVGDDGKITYENIFNGINLIYTPSKDKILEEYEIRAKRKIEYLVQKIDVEGLRYEKKDDGSIIFTDSTTSKFAFAVPQPVMYEKYNTKEKSFGLHYEFIEYGGNIYLAKIIDEDGAKWLEERANYPVMIDATILLTLFSYTSYPTVDGVWEIDAQTVGSGDLSINTNGLGGLTLACDSKNIEYETTTTGEALFPNLSCDGNIIIKTSITDPAKQNSLDISYSGFTTTVSSIVDTGKPIIVSSSLNPSVVYVGDILTISADIASSIGIASASANIVGIEDFSLSLVSGTKNNGRWQTTWKVQGTTIKPYEVLITALDVEGNNTTVSIGFFDPVTCLGGSDLAGADFNPAADCPGGFWGNFTNIGILSVNNGQTATVTTFDGVSSGGIATMSASVATIAGTLTASGKGWAKNASGGNGAGPGRGLAANRGGGAGYGGNGSIGDTANTAGSYYGNTTQAGDLGSSGGGGGTGSRLGGNGGGVIKITTTGDIVVNGTLSANGETAGNQGGGGSGGSIYLSTTSLSGNGSITTNGGNGTNGGGGGAGGRIAIYYTLANNYSGVATSSLGTSGSGGSSGSAFILSLSDGDLLIPSNSGGIWNGTDFSDWTFRNLTINGSVRFQGTNANLLTITATGSSTFGSGITVSAGGSHTTNSNGAGVYFNLIGNVTIPSTTTITATGLGYAGGAVNTVGSGPGGGTGSPSFGGGGGGYGGRGGNAQGGYAGGAANGSLTAPIDLGSGGGGSNYAGGAGGGAIRISTTGNLRIDGTISSGGNVGLSNAGGGGSGGGIYLTMKELQGNGSITAIGGNGTYGGAGGGGRIAMHCSDGGNWLGNSLASTSATMGGAAGGSGGLAGANGTVFTSNCYVVNKKVGGNTRVDGNVRMR